MVRNWSMLLQTVFPTAHFHAFNYLGHNSCEDRHVPLATLEWFSPSWWGAPYKLLITVTAQDCVLQSHHFLSSVFPLKISQDKSPLGLHPRVLVAASGHPGGCDMAPSTCHLNCNCEIGFWWVSSMLFLWKMLIRKDWSRIWEGWMCLSLLEAQFFHNIAVIPSAEALPSLSREPLAHG